MNPQLTAACAALVAIKDVTAASAFPSTWIRQVLPFCNPGYDYSRMRVHLIDSRLVVSGTYENRLSPSDLSPAQAAAIMNASDRLALAGDPLASPETPRHCQIGSLPLYVALEGKNRVALFKAAQRMMWVFVTPTEFPAPGELTLHRTLPFGIPALSFGGPHAILPVPAALDVLNAYGVPQGTMRFDGCARRKRRSIESRLQASAMRR